MEMHLNMKMTHSTHGSPKRELKIICIEFAKQVEEQCLVRVAELKQQQGRNSDVETSGNGEKQNKDIRKKCKGSSRLQSFIMAVRYFSQYLRGPALSTWYSLSKYKSLYLLSLYHNSKSIKIINSMLKLLGINWLMFKDKKLVIWIYFFFFAKESTNTSLMEDKGGRGGEMGRSRARDRGRKTGGRE